MRQNILKVFTSFMKWQAYLLCFVIFLYCYFPQQIVAQSESRSASITIINLIRGNGLGHENDDLVASLKAQWQVTQEASVNATWLMQYGALENSQMTDIAKHDMSGQEFGILFEIDRDFAQKAGVLFRGQGSWYFSDGLFLNSYDVSERRKLIDTAFSQFRQVFGYYPKTVGAWWIGGDSLVYMQRKYGITAALRAADQFDLDFYSIWGTPWSIPYIASKTNEAIPASLFEDSSKVVILQWAARDPYEGYSDPLYSLQDYFMRGYTPQYINYLADIFLSKPFDNLVIGLENGSTLEGFNQSYKTMLYKAKELEKNKNAPIVLVKDYSRQFLDQKKVFPNTSYFLSQDYDSSDQSFWYMSGQYRAGIQKRNDLIYLVDIRDYSQKVDEDFGILPNTQARLRINAPSIIDSIRFPDSKILLRIASESMSLREGNNDVIVYAGNDIVAIFAPGRMKVSIENTGEKEYVFGNSQKGLNTNVFLLIIFFTYFLFIFYKKRKFLPSLKSFLPICIPLCFATFLLKNQSAYLFDTKEIIVFNIFFLIHLIPISTMLFIMKVLPLITLIIAHYALTIAQSSRIPKKIYYVYLGLIIFLYVHVPYFPLDKSTGAYAALCVGLFAIIGSVVTYQLVRKLSLRRDKILVISALPIIILMCVYTIIYSRSRFALTNYEVGALEEVKNNKKNVIYVEQFDYAIKPIYKAVKPLLYNNLHIGEILTNMKWEVVVRPSNHILQLSNYEDTLIIIPKYLGSDISNYEIELLQLTKIFDNAQIQIYKRK